MNQRTHSYLGATLIYFSIFYLIGMTSMLKTPMSVSLQLQQSFLGMMDGSFFMGAVFGLFILAYKPTKKPVFTSFIICWIVIAGMQFQLLASIIPSVKLSILIISRFIFGAIFILQPLSQLIVTYYFNSESDQKLVQIWYAIGGIGDPLSILIIELLLNYLEMSWEVSNTIMMILFGVISIYSYKYIPQIEMSTEETGDSTSSSSSNSSSINIICSYYSSFQHILQSVLIIILVCLYYCMLLWLPYYFQRIGFVKIGGFISIGYPIAYIAGVFTIQPILYYFKGQYGKVFLVFMALSNLSGIILWFLGDDPSDIVIYAICIFATAYFSSGFGTYVSTTDLKNQISSEKQFLVINTFIRLAIQMFQLIISVISGALMKEDSQSFIKIYTLLTFIGTLALIYRMVRYPNSFQQQQKQQRQQLIC